VNLNTFIEGRICDIEITCESRVHETTLWEIQQRFVFDTRETITISNYIGKIFAKLIIFSADISMIHSNRFAQLLIGSEISREKIQFSRTIDYIWIYRKYVGVYHYIELICSKTAANNNSIFLYHFRTLGIEIESEETVHERRPSSTNCVFHSS